MSEKITVTTKGVILHAAAGDIIIDIPNFSSMGIDPSKIGTYHFYETDHLIASNDYRSTNYVSRPDILWRNLQEEPFPTFGLFGTDTPVENGSMSNVPGLGNVTHYVDSTNRVVVNVTMDGHMLNPGVVIRYLHEENGEYRINTIGFGNGSFKRINELASGTVWGNNAARIQRESIFEDNSVNISKFPEVSNLDLYNKDHFSNAFSSLGYSSVFKYNFQNTGWGALGAINSKFDDYSYDFGGSNYTIFGQADRISLPVLPDVSSPMWLNLGGGFYTPNSVVSSWHGKLLNSRNFVSPLTFDLDGDGIESNHIYSQNVFFDIDGDGYAEKVGWISADDGQLARDVNGDGIINDITELFGDDVMPAFKKLALLDSIWAGATRQIDVQHDNTLTHQRRFV